MTKLIIRCIVTICVIFSIWQSIIWLTDAPPFMLPPPWDVIKMVWVERALLLHHSAVTVTEMILGLFFGVVFGFSTALAMTLWRSSAHWMMPILVISQALPVFALAPLLVLWLGYGLASKVAMATLIIFFPVTMSIYNGLSAATPAMREQAQVMTGQSPSSHWRTIRFILIPAALPTIGAGLRIAVSVVPIGAVVGEWVGSSAGLGHLMLLSNARVQTDLMFAALMVLAVIGLFLFWAVDRLMRHMTRHHDF